LCRTSAKVLAFKALTTLWHKEHSSVTASLHLLEVPLQSLIRSFVPRAVWCTDGCVVYIFQGVHVAPVSLAVHDVVGLSFHPGRLELILPHVKKTCNIPARDRHLLSLSIFESERFRLRSCTVSPSRGLCRRFHRLGAGGVLFPI